MRFTVSGFKSIKQVDEFDFRPLTILAGINSSGKSSLIQALLLLKQSFESDNKNILNFDGDYIKASWAIDLIHGKNENCHISYNLQFQLDEINIENFTKYIPEGRKLKKLVLFLDFYLKENDQSSFNNGIFGLNKFAIELLCEKGKKETLELSKEKNAETYYIKKTNEQMFQSPMFEDKQKLNKLVPTFMYGFIPEFCERDGKYVTSTLVKAVKETLIKIFGEINYISPQRVKPALGVAIKNELFRNVGINGENTRFLIDRNKHEQLDGYNVSFIDRLNYWIVDRMKLAKGIKVINSAEKIYYVKVINETGVEVDLCQTGFGLSQILPIVTQGLLTPNGGTLIVEDPDVHMHPSVQAELVNFFADMVAHGRKVIIETHSDHIVTRMRLLLAQKQLDSSSVNVCFVTNNYGHSEYRSCALTPKGIFTEKLPEGFMDSQEQDFREIIKSQLNAHR